jgi:hypothetical protein
MSKATQIITSEKVEIYDEEGNLRIMVGDCGDGMLGARIYDAPTKEGGAEIRISPDAISITAESIKAAKIESIICPLGKKIGADNKANPEKDKFISQVLDEFGIGKDGKLEGFFYNMAEKIAELCYEIKQLKENGAKTKIDPEKIIKAIAGTLDTEPNILIEGKHSVPLEEFDKILHDAPVVNLGSGKIDESMAEPIK